jgi:dUTP pyrophosphatase
MMRVAKLHEKAIIPTKKHPDDAGWDLYAVGMHLVEARSFKRVPTGITIEIPKNVVGLIKPKGSSNYLVGAGVIDAGYQGEILVKVANIYSNPIQIMHQVAFAQIVFLPIYNVGLELDEVTKDEIYKVKTMRGPTAGILRGVASAEIIKDEAQTMSDGTASWWADLEHGARFWD